MPLSGATPVEKPIGWGRSAKWSQFRSAGRQRGGWLDRVRRDRRVRRHRSARCQKRGVQSNRELGVAKLGTDAPARRSRWLSPAWWTGPPPIPRRGPPRATNRMTRSSRRSPPQEAARGFWIRAWGQRESTKEGTSRLSSPASWGETAQGWIGHPRISCAIELSLHRTPDPDVDALCVVTRYPSRNAAFCPMDSSY